MRREEQPLPTPAPTSLTPVFPAATFSNDKCSLNGLSLLKRSQREIWCGPLTPGEHMYLHLSGNTLAQAYFFSKDYWFCWLAAGESIKNKLQSQRSRVSNGLHDNRDLPPPPPFGISILRAPGQRRKLDKKSWMCFQLARSQSYIQGFLYRMKVQEMGYNCGLWSEVSMCVSTDGKQNPQRIHIILDVGKETEFTLGAAEKTVLSWGLK